MLVLTRRKGQSIVLGDNIEISIVEVSGDSVRLGIEAPREISIYRREIYDAIREENIAAARAAGKMKGQISNIFSGQQQKDKNEKETSPPEKRNAAPKDP